MCATEVDSDGCRERDAESGSVAVMVRWVFVVLVLGIFGHCIIPSVLMLLLLHTAVAPLMLS